MNGTCGHHSVDADQVLGWLVKKLQEVFLGPGRDELVADIKRRLKAEAKGASGSKDRLEKRLAELDREIARLVKAVRTTDVPELVTESASARSERDCVRAELGRAGRLEQAEDLDAEAERLADEVWNLGEAFADADPAVLRELLQRAVVKITCRWEQTEKCRRTWCRLVAGTVELRDSELFAGLSGGGAGV